MIRLRIDINGIVQGVGFRPFLHRLAKKYGVLGTVRNTSDGLELDIECGQSQIDGFLEEIRTSSPEFAVIDDIHVQNAEPVSTLTINQDSDPEHDIYTDFKIIPSTGGDPHTLVSPDIGICEDCRRELLDTGDRHYRYPFINCTNCGPRFSILKKIPYDRADTTMSDFPMCDDCAAEYNDIDNRRYHAQPTACAACGPRLTFVPSGIADHGDNPDLCRNKSAKISDSDKMLFSARKLLYKGGILAIKGIGGFHLSCRADDPEAVSRLRERKHREEKPLAVMCRSLDIVKKICYVSEAEAAILKSQRSPIVLLHKKDPDSYRYLSQTPELGIILPYTPLHVLLFEKTPFESANAPGEDLKEHHVSCEDMNFDMLVMTSANTSDCPICIGNDEARLRLDGIADGYLMHDRDIVSPCDDSLVRIYDGNTYFIRRSRGYAPQPLTAAFECSGILALGSEQKASFAIGCGHKVFLSQHIGDLKNIETYDNYRSQIERFEELFGIRPSRLVCDLHPDYMSTSYAENEHPELPLTKVQHHHAHMASCMADNRLDGSVIALTWDGTGLGTDNTIWGGECLIGDYSKFRRVCSIRPAILCGGDRAVTDIRRIALALAIDAGLPDSASGLFKEDDSDENGTDQNMQALSKLIKCGINGTETAGLYKSSGIGRLFDGIYSLISGRRSVSYEGQGAQLLEAMADPVLNVNMTKPGNEPDYSIDAASGTAELSEPKFYMDDEGIYRFDTREMIRSLVCMSEHSSAPDIAAEFHVMLAEAGTRMCIHAREISPELNRVVLSGGVFLNTHLLELLTCMLRKNGFEVFTHKRVSTCDEGIALGQMAIAAHQKNI